MRIAYRGVDHKSLWIDQKVRETQPGRMSGEGKLNKTTGNSEEGGVRRGEGIGRREGRVKGEGQTRVCDK